MNTTTRQIIVSGSYITATPRAQITWELRQSEKGAEFSAQGSGRAFGGGQCIDKIAEAHKDDPKVQEIAAIWSRWHLNGMRAGTPEQKALGWGHGRNVALDLVTMTEAQKTALAKRNEVAQGRKRAAYVAEQMGKIKDSARERLRIYQEITGKSPNDHGMEHLAAALNVKTDKPRSYVDGWQRQRLAPIYEMHAKLAAHLDNMARNLYPAAPVVSEVFEDSLGAPCPVTGYLYGSQWLHETIPADVIEQIKGWASWQQPTETLADFNARTFLETHGITCRLVRADKPGNWTPCGHHYRVTLSRGDGLTDKSRHAFDYWGSKNDADKGRAATVADVLGCVASDVTIPDTIEGYADEFGGDLDSIETRKQAVRAVQSGKRLRAFFTAAEIEGLDEVRD